MNIHKATKRYEAWVAKHATPVPADLKTKHERMAEALFPFFRGTFYRWAQLWPKVCPELAAAPEVLGVGDLHVENFGTWRDSEGRLIWGINDLDEVYWMSYANDLVRLAASAQLAAEDAHLDMVAKEAAEAILEGYCDGLESGGRAFVLDGRHPWLREVAVSELREPVGYWKKMEELPRAREVPESAREAMEALLPERGLKYDLRKRVAGMGSLGHPRFVALADWRGGRVAREAKALVPSAWVWASDQPRSQEILYNSMLSRAVRCPDPFVHLRGHWVVRRLAPDCSRIELASLPKKRHDLHLLNSMGFETANAHLGTDSAIKKIKKDLGKRSGNWVGKAAVRMADALRDDWKDWKS
jgi:uncharacterized protein (DUF2252 family)